MPNLDLQSSHEFWKQYDDPTIYRVLVLMETVEDWSYDGDPELEKAISSLGQSLDKVKNYESNKEEQYIILLAHLKTSRILRTLQAIDSIEPGSASRVLIYAEENNTTDNPITGLFLRRNIIFERLRLLSRVFSSQRFELILKAMEQEHA